MVIQPECILFDEPLSALDALLREEMRGELKNLTQKLNVTSIFVTHDQTEAMSLSDHIAVLNGGRVLQYDSPQAVYAHPATPFVARFVGKSNWLNGHTMIRPEELHMAHEGDQGAYPMRVAASQFMGDGYELTLADSEHTWHYFTRTQHPIGTEMLIGIDRDQWIEFQNEKENVS